MEFLSLTKPYGMTRTLRVNVAQRLLGDNTIEREWISRRVQRLYQIPWRTLTRTERTLLDSHFQSARGKLLGNIGFLDPFDDQTYICRLNQDSLTMSEDEATRWSSSLTLAQIDWTGKTNKPPVAAFPLLSSGAATELPYHMMRWYVTVIGEQADFSEARFEELQLAGGHQRWSVGGDNLTDVEASTLLDAWEGNGGPWSSFSFTEPETSVLYTAHFTDTEVTHTLNQYNSNSVRLQIEELDA
jgi:hypothetical protein